MKLENVTFREKIYESYKTIVYRGNWYDKSVILKILKSESPQPQDIYRYQQEYYLTQKLNLEGVVKSCNLIPYQRSLIIIFEDIEATSLKDLYGNQPLSLAQFLPLAIKISNILENLHQAQIIHKDINPSNIVFNPVTQQVRIIDLGLSSQLSQEYTTIEDSNLLEGTIPYISPEQTGRINRYLDYRSDLYSLGVTFYELLTGKLPFISQDFLELIHCHIAKQPVTPQAHNPLIPKILASIILKLLAKDAEGRYQSAWGLKSDLEKCWQQWQSHGIIVEFNLGEDDIWEKWQTPQKIYGRETEIASLLASLARVTAGNKELVLITGYPGIGKSALVREITQAIQIHKGYLISGKFEQLERNIPYASIIQAFTALIKQILTEPPEQVSQWKIKLSQALVGNTKVLLNIIPELALIVDSANETLELAPAENQNRFNLVFQKFINVFAQHEHPLVLFLDDLQWADSASLKLLAWLLKQEKLQNLLLIVAYRINEVTTEHLWQSLLRELSEKEVKINEIYLDVLKIEDIEQLLQDIFPKYTPTLKPLAQLILQKTQGNPFFVQQFLQSLASENLIKFNKKQKLWEWEIEQINRAQIPDNVVDLVANKIKKMPTTTQNILKLAACIGNTFELAILEIVSQQYPQIIVKELIKVMQAGLIIPLGDNYKFLTLDINPPESKIAFKFAHDRIQQAAYSLIPWEQTKEIHLDIANLLYSHLATLEEEKIFEISNHYNLALSLVKDTETKQNITYLNCLAAKKAKSSAAYEAAFSYFQIGLSLLKENAWEQQYDFTLDLYLQTAEMAYFCGDFAKMEALGQTILIHSRNILDQSKFYELKLSAYVLQQKPLEAIEIGKQILTLLGLKDLHNPDYLKILVTTIEINWLINGKNISHLLELPPMTNKRALAIISIINRLTPSIFLVQSNLMLILIKHALKLSITYGNSPFIIYIYAFYGAICCGVFNQIQSGKAWGELAADLCEKIQSKEEEPKATISADFCIKPWYEWGSNILLSLKENLQKSIEVGGLEFAGYNADIYGIYSIYCHHNLTIAYQEVNELAQIVKSFNQERNYHQVNSSLQVIANLVELSPEPHLIQGKYYNAQERIPIEINQGDYSQVCCISTHQLLLAYLFGENALALTHAEVAHHYLKAGMGTMTVAIFYFYNALALLASNQRYSTCKKSVNQSLKKLQVWAKHAPMNYLHKYYLVLAEKYRVLTKISLAEKYYKLAIRYAQKHQYLQEEALAYELAAKFHLTQEENVIAKAYIQQAHYCYLRWGAQAKAHHLEVTYPEIFELTTNNTLDVSLVTTSKNYQKNLDLNTLFQASQAIVEELSLEKLLTKLMLVLLTNSGAEKGYLLVKENQKMYLKVAAKAETNSYEILQQPLPCETLANGIINYVYNTQKPLVLDEAWQQGEYTQDEYIQAQKIKSVLCAPLITQGKLKGIVYLENNLTKGAFTSERLALIQLLSQQAAIALENAQIYSNLEQIVTARTQELSQALENLQLTQQELIHSEKMAALGQLIASIAHEINTPLAVISSATGYIDNFLQNNLASLLQFWQSLDPLAQTEFWRLFTQFQQSSSLLSTRELRQVKKELLEQLQTYELANPENTAKMLLNIGIYGNLAHWSNLLNHSARDELLQNATNLAYLKTSINNTVTAIDKASKIVFALKTYARHEQQAQKTQAEIIPGIETVLVLYQNLFKQGVEIIRDYQENLPPIWCYPEELNQVWTNLIYNALQAMEYRGTLTIQVKLLGEQVIVSFTDTGCGIAPELITHIFEPFFTTKPQGEGTGLGLHIVKQIITKHQGEITATSQPGTTIFTVSLPLK